MTKRVYRSRKIKILGGVCGGIANYLDIDPVIVRLLWAFLCLAGGFGAVAYAICWIVIPLEPEVQEAPTEGETAKNEIAKEAEVVTPSTEKESSLLLMGIFLISLGVLWITTQHFHLRGFWGMGAILLGIMIISYGLIEKK
ncbi:MAG: DNA-binding transcriptional activator PspC [Candidatus Methanolliviera sp. GoM_oil]|nr:MAG: DNA-binding transcriptional activator PspC [Candidatus Methanolliviera sp. GoM_oil]